MLLYLTPVHDIGWEENICLAAPQRRRTLPLLSNTKPVTYVLGYLNSPEIAEQHASVFKQFFAFLELVGKDLDEQGLAFLNHVRRQSKRSSRWAIESIRLYVESLKKRMHDNTSNDRKMS